MVWVVNAKSGQFTPGEDPVPICIGGMVGLRAGLDGCEKSRLPLRFGPRTIQSIASRYTD